MSNARATRHRASPWASGPIVLAGGMLVIAGLMQVFIGTAALAHDKIYDGTPQYVFEWDLSTWGWAQLLTGILSVAAGFAALRGLTWARIVGIGLAGLSMLVQMLFAPHFPIWSVLVIAVDVVIIWALATYRRDASSPGHRVHAGTVRSTDTG